MHELFNFDPDDIKKITIKYTWQILFYKIFLFSLIMSAAAAAKIYIVTGASRGLGLEFVKQISAKGDTVFACARNPTDSKGLSSLVDNKRVFGVTLDANNTESVKVKTYT